MQYWFYFIPLITGLTGWLAHWIIIRYFLNNMLPRRKKMLAEKVGAAAAKAFSQFNGIEEKINDPRNLESILPVIEQHIDVFLNEKLKTEMPVISMFIGHKTTDKLKEVFIKEIQVLFPQIIGQFASNLKNTLDIREMISTRISSLPDPEFIKILRTNLKGEIKSLQLLGLISGFAAGIMALVFAFLTQ
ncbi:MAG TPA: hypothetical protein VFO70_06360 [Chitinophagaceae bacterium]|nr:hypothetical protein [Chitinophagaceae bacterium]